jgi:aerobic C4-dicarboxylate transport protein
MRIVDFREITLPIASSIANAYIDFSKMTCSLVVISSLFLAQATNTHLGLREQITLMVVLMITSKGSAGVAGAGFITLAATLASMHTIPVAALVLLLGVERLTNIARAVMNVIGNSVATIVIAKWERAFDKQRSYRLLGRVRGE